MKGTPPFRMFPTVGPVESLIVRLPETSTSCASAARIGRKIQSAAEKVNCFALHHDSLPATLGREAPRCEELVVGFDSLEAETRGPSRFAPTPAALGSQVRAGSNSVGREAMARKA